MRVFITGGAGFIGSHLVERLLSAGHSVTAYDNLLLGRRELLQSSLQNKQFKFIEADLRDTEFLTQAMMGHDLVYHLAANSDISGSALSNDVDLQNGTIATYSTLEAMRITGVKKIIFASTSALYGEADVKPTPESYGPLLPISLYGASKLACEGLLSAYADAFAMQVWIYRFANIVGSHATHGAIHDFVLKLMKNPKELQVLGDGSQRKSYLHVSECIAGMDFGFRNSDAKIQVFNLASEGVTRVRFIAEQVAARFAQISGVTPQVVFGDGDRGWRGDVPYTHLDGSRLNKLGWRPQWSSDEAVRKAIDEITAEMTAKK